MRFSSEPVEVRPRGVVESVKRLSDQRVLGSATRVCLTPEEYERTVLRAVESAPSNWREDLRNVNRAYEYWVTPAHVTNALEDVVTASGIPLHLEMRDELMDFALFSAPKTSGKCLPLADSLYLGSVFDIEAGFLFVKQAELEIEAPDTRTWALRSYRMQTLVSTFKGAGIPGRDLAGPLLAVLARGFRGQSGGAVIGQVDTGGQVNEPSYGVTLANYAFPKMIGMIIAVDNEGRRMAALPAPTMYQRIKRHFASPEPLSPLRARSISGGTHYPLINATHYRGWLPAAGTGGMADGGSGGMADGGTGGMADGYPPVVLPSPLPVSGLQFGPVRWLTFGTRWAEYEALTPEVFRWLETGHELEGIYEDEGKLKLTRSIVPIPDWFSLSPQERDVYSMNPWGTQELLASFVEKPECHLTLGMQRRGSSSFGTLVMVCSRLSSEGREFWLSLVGPRDDTPKMDFHLSLRRMPCPGDVNCELKLDARMYPDAPNAQFDRDEFFRDYWTRVSRLGADSGMAMITSGLRLFQKDRTVMMVTRLGGYRILTEAPGGEKLEISGPAGLMPDSMIFRRELLNSSHYRR